MSPILEIEALSARYGEAEVLRNISVRVPEGGVSVLLGPNGAGKTTTLRAICRAEVATSGVIRFMGRDLTGMRTDQVVKAGIGHVPDGRGTFMNFTVAENLRIAASSRRDREVNADRERIFSYFPRLRERLDQRAGTLSGGEQQMLAIGRALLMRPRLLLLDEPSFGLAPIMVAEIFRILKEINRTDGISILLVEQNVGLALDLADEAYLLEQGSIALAGTAADFRASDLVQRSYLAA